MVAGKTERFLPALDCLLDFLFSRRFPCSAHCVAIVISQDGDCHRKSSASSSGTRAKVIICLTLGNFSYSHNISHNARFYLITTHIDYLIDDLFGCQPTDIYFDQEFSLSMPKVFTFAIYPTAKGLEGQEPPGVIDKKFMDRGAFYPGRIQPGHKLVEEICVPSTTVPPHL